MEQVEIAGAEPQTELMRAAEAYLKQKAEIKEQQSVLDALAKEVHGCMNREGKSILSLSFEGCRFFFEIDSTEKLKIAKR